jgi:multidrug efflux pump subunit AcrA (membrane-fusion protein)
MFGDILMALKHNKKRNVGLINEFFARYMARAIIERRDSDLKKAKELFSKHFQKGTDLHRELRLFSSLYETRLQSREAAASLIEQAKQVCKLQSQARIDLEKTALLREINQQLGEPKFFDQEVAGYRDYATIQVLLNHWRFRVTLEVDESDSNLTASKAKELFNKAGKLIGLADFRPPCRRLSL